MSSASGAKSYDVDRFLPSPKFSGSKSGYAFKMGDEGLGYYRDGGKDVKTGEDRGGKRRRIEKGATAAAAAVKSAAEEDAPQQAFVTEDNRSGPMPR